MQPANWVFIQSVITLSYFSPFWFCILSNLPWWLSRPQRGRTEGRQVWWCSNFLFSREALLTPFAIFFSDSSPLIIQSAALLAFYPVERKCSTSQSISSRIFLPWWPFFAINSYNIPLIDYITKIGQYSLSYVILESYMLMC